MKHRQIAEIVERSLNEFVAARFNPGRRSNIEATTKNIDWHIAPRPNPSALTIVPIIRMEFSRCRPRDKRTRTVPINCIGKDPLIPGINVEHGHAAAPAAHKADPRSIGKPARNIGAARQTKPEGRSLNSEILARLERSYAQATPDSGLRVRQEDLEEFITQKVLQGLRDAGISTERPEQTLVETLERATLDYPPRQTSDQEPAYVSNPRNRPLTAQQLRSTAEGYRRSAERHEARGAYDKAAQMMRELADKLERDVRELTLGQESRSVPYEEAEAPMPRQSRGDK